MPPPLQLIEIMGYRAVAVITTVITLETIEKLSETSATVENLGKRHRPPPININAATPAAINKGMDGVMKSEPIPLNPKPGA